MNNSEVDGVAGEFLELVVILQRRSSGKFNLSQGSDKEVLPVPSGSFFFFAGEGGGVCYCDRNILLH